MWHQFTFHFERLKCLNWQQDDVPQVMGSYRMMKMEEALLLADGWMGNGWIMNKSQDRVPTTRPLGITKPQANCYRQVLQKSTMDNSKSATDHQAACSLNERPTDHSCSSVKVNLSILFDRALTIKRKLSIERSARCYGIPWLFNSRKTF